MASAALFFQLKQKSKSPANAAWLTQNLTFQIQKLRFLYETQSDIN